MIKTVTYTAECSDRLRRYYTLQEVLDFAAALTEIHGEFDPSTVQLRIENGLEVTIQSVTGEAHHND